MIQKITTKSGSFYFIDEDRGFWRKNSEQIERIFYAHGIYPEDLIKWHNKEPYEKQPIKVGTHLHIGSRDVWWLSTPIVSIEEVDYNHD